MAETNLEVSEIRKPDCEKTSKNTVPCYELKAPQTCQRSDDSEPGSERSESTEYVCVTSDMTADVRKQKGESKSRSKGKYEAFSKYHVEDIPMTSLGQRSGDTLEESPVIQRHQTSSSDPSATLDSMGTMNASIYSTSSSTYTGTLKRGKKEQPVEVQLQLTQGEIERLNRSTLSDNKSKETIADCTVLRGPHILLLSIIYLPLAFLASLFVNFYICTLCWYNVYLCLSEDRAVWHRIFLCPLVILSFPIVIIIIPLGVALCAAISQVSMSWVRWLIEVRDFEHGFYGSLCDRLGLPECSPYQVIILNESGAINAMDVNAPGTVL